MATGDGAGVGDLAASTQEDTVRDGVDGTTVRDGADPTCDVNAGPGGDPPDPRLPDVPIDPVFATLPPPLITTASLALMTPLVVTVPAAANDTPMPVDDLSVPLLVTLQMVPDAPSMSSAVEVIVPVLVMVRGLVVPFRTIGPVTLLLIVVT
jgi:hypothetical protein